MSEKYPTHLCEFALPLAPILFDIYLLSQLFRMSDSLAKNPVSGRLGRFSSGLRDAKPWKLSSDSSFLKVTIPNQRNRLYVTRAVPLKTNGSTFRPDFRLCARETEQSAGRAHLFELIADGLWAF